MFSSSSYASVLVLQRGHSGSQERISVGMEGPHDVGAGVRWVLSGYVGGPKVVDTIGGWRVVDDHGRFLDGVLEFHIFFFLFTGKIGFDASARVSVAWHCEF